MSAKAERPKNRRVKLVGGGIRKTRSDGGKSTSGGLKAARRSMRHAIKDKKLTPAAKAALKARLRELLLVKNARGNA